MKTRMNDILLIIIFIISVIFFFWYIFGNSLTFEQALLIFILCVVMANFANLKSLKTDCNNLKQNFLSLAKDFKQHIRHK